jgi:hypothetical protein
MNNSAYIVTMKSGKEYCTNEQGQGVFQRMKDGSWLQQRGNMQAPGGNKKFTSERAFVSYLKKQFSDD